MKNFFKPTKVTWIVFLSFASVTVFLPLLFAGFIIGLWLFDAGGPQQSFIKVLKALLPFIAIAMGEYLIASIVSKIWYYSKRKGNPNNYY